MLRILENITGGWIRSDRAYIKVCRIFSPKFSVWQRLTYRPSIQISIDHIVVHKIRRRFRWVEQIHVLVISLRVYAGALTEATAFTVLDEHDHIDVGNSNLVYVARHPTWNLTMHNNARYRDRNSRCNYCGNFRRCLIIIRHWFFNTDHCTRRAFGRRIAAIYSRRERNCSRIRSPVNEL